MDTPGAGRLERVSPALSGLQVAAVAAESGVTLSAGMAARPPRPEPPREPEAAECCQSGCDPCVYDRYWDACEKYERALAEWLAADPEDPHSASPSN